jgi:hypothetical protein
VITQAEIEAYVEHMRRAADGASEWPEQWERLRRRPAPGAASPSRLVIELRRAYEEATGKYLDCE